MIVHTIESAGFDCFASNNVYICDQNDL